MKRLALVLLTPLLLLAFAVAVLCYLVAVVASPDKAWRLAIASDQLANTAANGNEDETISSRANRARLEGRRWGCVLCRVLDVFERDHCAKSAGR
jgi:hypothetical protein